MSAVQRLRGQPLVALLAVLAGWMGGRISTWETPLPVRPAAVQAMALAPAGRQGAAGTDGVQAYPGPLSPAGAGFYAAYGPPYGALYGLGPVVREAYPVFVKVPVWAAGAPAHPRSSELGRRNFPPSSGLAPGFASAADWPLAVQDAPSLDFLPRAGENGGLPPGLPPLGQFAAQPYPPSSITPPPAPVTQPKRWSMDAWALVRQGSAGPLTNGALPASYGASQSGAILRYRLYPGDTRQVTAYLRTTATLGASRGETSAAAGLSARPFPAVPVIAAMEARLTRQGGMTWVQPAVMGVTQLPYFRLPGGLRGEAYAQAGYVGGRFATPFADGQLRMDRSLLTRGRTQVRLGGGLWGGAQKGAERLDAGPSATVTFPLWRGGFGRLAADWRFRVGGDAEPGSGPAVTLSAGF